VVRDELNRGNAEVVHETESGQAAALTIRYYLLRRWQIETLIGSLCLLNKQTTTLAKEIQKIGRPRDLAEERWIVELADIYENAFGQPARVWGSSTASKKQRGRFFRLLELSRPTLFFRYGKLNPRQIERTLKKRHIERGRNLTLKDIKYLPANGS
jgi:hypothetical protein